MRVLPSPNFVFRVTITLAWMHALWVASLHNTGHGQDHDAGSGRTPRGLGGRNERIPPHASLPSSTVPDGLGVNIHFTDPKPGEMDMLAAAGFRWVRMDFVWSKTEVIRGEYDFSSYERLIKALDAHSLRAVFILDYSNGLYEPDRSVTTDAGREAFGNWAAAAASKFKGRGILWEIWNEPDSGFWKPKPDPEQYSALALAAAKAIHAVAPDEAVIGPATATINHRFLEACFKAGLLEHWAAVSVHPYRRTGPETAEYDYHRLRQLMAKYAPPGKAIPILSGEWGYSAVWKDLDVDKQGQLLARQWLINLENEIPLSIWYDWHDDGVGAHDPEHHFGTVGHKYYAGRELVYDPKPAYLAAKTLVSTLSGCRFLKRVAVGNINDYVLLFEKYKTHESRLVAWTTVDPHEIRIPSGPCVFDVIEHTGQQLPGLNISGQSISLTLTNAPQYIVLKQPISTLANLARAHSLRISFSLSEKSLTARIENVLNTGFIGRARLVETDGMHLFTNERPLLLSGDAEALIHFPFKSQPSGMVRFGLRIENEAGDLIVTVPSQRFAAIADILLTSGRVEAKGDSMVESQQSFVKAEPHVTAPNPDSAVMQLTYRFNDGYKFLRVAPEKSQQLMIAGEPKAFGLWVYGDGRRTKTGLRVIDATGQTWQPSGPIIDWHGWQYVRYELNPLSSHWGGANDGVIHYPLSWDSLFLLDNPSKQLLGGAILLAAPMAVY